MLKAGVDAEYVEERLLGLSPTSFRLFWSGGCWKMSPRRSMNVPRRGAQDEKVSSYV